MYIDASALLKLYVREPESEEVVALTSDAGQSTARVTFVEVRRNLARLLRGASLARARDGFTRDWSRLHIVEVDAELCERAAEIAELTRAKTLDAIHVAAGEQDGGPFLTYDVAQARAAAAVGLSVVGAS